MTGGTHTCVTMFASLTKALTKTLQPGKRMGELVTMLSPNVMLILCSTVRLY